MKKNRMKALGRLAMWMEDLLFPQDVLCLCCDHALGEDARDGLCSLCQAALERLWQMQEMREAQGHETPPEGIAYIHAAYVYEAQARKLIHRLKYESVRRAAVPLAHAMAALPSGEEEILVPVPTDRRRERRRGFNQATVLSELIGRELGMEVVLALTRTQSRRPQTGLSASQRMTNLVECMKASEAVSGKRVLLVDDVCTTGATAAEAARALYAAGAVSVSVFAAARAAGGKDEPKDPFALPKGSRKSRKNP